MACRECPYKKSSAPGYLGESSWEPEKFLTQLDQKEIHPCHLTVDWETNDISNAKTCEGALQFMKNICKLPIDPKAVQQLKSLKFDPSEIFSRRIEFINHHQKTK